MNTIRLTGKITLVQLEYIIAVDNYRHFAKAAENCFVIQPTLSMQIQKLEDQLGVIIFDRSKQPVVPTEIGKKIISQTRIILNETKKLNDLIQQKDNEIRGELRIGIIPTIAPYMLPLIISKFIDAYPLVNVKVKEHITEHIVEKLNKGLLDVGILATPLNDPAFIEKPLFYELFVGYVSSSSALFNKENISFDDLKSENIWILNEGHCFREQVINICNLKSFPPQNSSFTYESGSIEAIRRLVDTYGGVTLVPELATIGMDQKQKSKLRLFEAPGPSREVSLVLYRSHLKKKLVDALFNVIKDAIPVEISERENPNVIEWK